jgi:hypothetical protein
MLFEDAHWADPTTLEVINLLIHGVRDIPLLIVVTQRSEFSSRWSHYGHVAALTLTKLTSGGGTNDAFAPILLKNSRFDLKKVSLSIPSGPALKQIQSLTDTGRRSPPREMSANRVFQQYRATFAARGARSHSQRQVPHLPALAPEHGGSAYSRGRYLATRRRFLPVHGIGTESVIASRQRE